MLTAKKLSVHQQKCNLIGKQKYTCVILLQLINTIAYGILRLSQLRGGQGFLSHTPENNVKIILIDLKFGTHN